MSERNFRKMLENQWACGNFVCVGLDSEWEKIPSSICLPTKRETVTEFNARIVEATRSIVCAYKPNLAFYMAFKGGMYALEKTIANIKELAPNVPVILDAKDMDIGNTNLGYVKMAFECLGADAITVNPYLGMEAAQPFLDQKDKGVIVLCRTSNPGAGELQDLLFNVPNESLLSGSECPQAMPLYQVVARNVAEHWNKNGNCAVVVGATYPEELGQVRRLVGDMPILIPGIGAQGGDIQATVQAGRDDRGQGMIINSSRGIIFASSAPDFAVAARRETMRLRDAINKYR